MVYDKIIGIIGAGFQGKGIAYWLAMHDFHCIVYDVNTNQLSKIRQEMSVHKKKRLLNRYITITSELTGLHTCDLFIESVPEKLELKQDLFSRLQKIAKPGAVLASNSSTFPPTLLSAHLAHPEQFINIHFLGITFGNTRMEIIPGTHTSTGTYELSREILLAAGFSPIRTGEGAGFVFNRISLAEVANMFFAESLGLVALDDMLKYILFRQMSLPVASIDFIGLDIIHNAIRFLHSRFGERYFISDILAAKVKDHELGKKTGRGFLSHSGESRAGDLVNSEAAPGASSIRSVFLFDLQINNTNFLVQLLAKNKQVAFHNRNIPYFSALQLLNPKLHDKITAQCFFPGAGEPLDKYDLIFDFPAILPIDQQIERIKTIRSMGGDTLPIVVNLPIYKLGDLVSRLDGQDCPALIFGMHCQKTYISNTELIKQGPPPSPVYEAIKMFIREVAGDCIEVNDHHARPLTFLLVAKMFEAIRIVEEGIADKEEIEKLMIGDSIFKDIDYLGLDNLAYLADYCYPVYGETFAKPQLLMQLIEARKLGVATREGFYKYA